MKFFLPLIIFLHICDVVVGQRFWQPLQVPAPNNRYNDLVIISPTLAYATNSDSIIIKTTDAGQTWQVMNKPRGKSWRSLCFLDSLTGFIGKLQTSNVGVEDTSVFFKTIDGGQSWTTVVLPGPRPFGICGMSRVNDSTAVAVGRYSGASRFYKTIDKGVSWTYKDLTSVANGGLVDVHFFSPDTGLALGSQGNYSTGGFDSSAVVLYTTDGGNNWIRVKKTNNGRELGWKISFPSRLTGYISIQQTLGTTRTFLKTTDGGVTWQELPYVTQNNYSAQGIGFINDTLGWIGGKCCAGDPTVFRTEDGGLSWVKDTIGEGVNRFRFMGNFGYAAGYNQIFRYPRNSVSVGNSLKKLPAFKVIRTESSLALQIPERFFDKSLEVVLYDLQGRSTPKINVQWPVTNIDISGLANEFYILTVIEYGHVIFTQRVSGLK